MVEQGLAILLVIGSLVYAPFLGAIMNKRAGGTAWTFTAFLLCTVSLICGLLAFPQRPPYHRVDFHLCRILVRRDGCRGCCAFRRAAGA